MQSFVNRRMVELARNNLTDPANRGDDVTETITSDGTNSMELANKGLKNVYYITNNTQDIPGIPM